MTGERLKEIIFKSKVSQSEIARQLGMSQQSLNQMLSAADVKSSLLERIAKVLNVSVSCLYGEHDSATIANGHGSVAVTGNNNVAGNVTIGDAAVLKERITMLERLLEEKERLINVLMEK